MELLSPAGDWEALRAAVQNGADAVYLGGSMGNARAGAVNFDEENLCRALDYCHERGVKLYLTANTLLFDEEFEALYAMLLPSIRYGLDAAIVQDLGVAAFLQENFPQLRLHASTQMSVSNLQGAKLVKQLGFSRVVPARECDLNELKRMVQAGIEVECFGHGALCVAFSGQCLLSAFIGARSGNRGKCAQPCRLKYRLGTEEGYFLSTRDLCTIDCLSQLVQSGVTSLKLEGRLKRGEYVAAVTSAYRRALDAVQEGRSFDSRKEIRSLSAVFSRGFTPGYLFGKNDADVMHTQAPNHSGLLLERAVQVKNGRAKIKVRENLEVGDTLLWRKGQNEGTVQVKTLPVKGLLEIGLPMQAQGGSVSLVRSAEQEREAKESYQKENRRRRVNLSVTLRLGEKPTLVVEDDKNHRVCVTGAEEVQPARKQALQREDVVKQLRKMGDVPVQAETIAVDLEGDLFLPVSALNALRRSGVEAYLDLFRTRVSIEKKEILPLAGSLHETQNVQKPLLILQSGDVGQLKKAATFCDELYYAPQDLRTEALEAALQGLPTEKPVYAVLPPLLFTQETDAVIRLLQKSPNVAGIVANNLGQIQAWWEMERKRPVIAGPSINLLNRRALAVVKQLGIERATVSVESTFGNTARVSRFMPCEMIVHGQLPLMTLRHCPLRTQKGEGKGHANCELCRKQGYALTDRKGVTFPMRPYVGQSGCYVQLYNAHTLYGLGNWERIRALPVQALRVIGGAEEAYAYYRALQGEEGVTLPVEQPTNGLWQRTV